MDNVIILNKNNSLLNQFLLEIRSEEIQKDRLRFRTNLERISEVLAMESSKHLKYGETLVKTPLGELTMDVIQNPPVIVSILRAGVPMHNGFLRYYDKADNGFISAFRHTTRGNKFIVKVEYKALPSLEGRTLLLVDPMIATGTSLVLSYEAIIEQTKPDNVIVAGIIASEQGVEYVKRNIPEATILVAAVDKELTSKSYIVPGLGDAGDLAFGPKE